MRDGQQILCTGWWALPLSEAEASALEKWLGTKLENIRRG
jgi:hypothetical protein